MQERDHNVLPQRQPFVLNRFTSALPLSFSIDILERLQSVIQSKILQLLKQNLQCQNFETSSFFLYFTDVSFYSVVVIKTLNCCANKMLSEIQRRFLETRHTFKNNLILSTIYLKLAASCAIHRWSFAHILEHHPIKLMFPLKIINLVCNPDHYCVSATLNRDELHIHHQLHKNNVFNYLFLLAWSGKWVSKFIRPTWCYLPRAIEQSLQLSLVTEG